MAGFLIPNILKPGFAEILKLSDSDFDSIINVLSQTKPGTGPNNFKKLLIEKIPSVELSILPQVIFSFGSLLLREQTGNVAELAQNLAKSYNEETNEDIEKLSKRLQVIFENSTNLKLTVKAFDLLGENDHVYIDSRVITDIRTIFNDELNDKDRNAVIFHNLKFEYRHNNEQKEFYFSLDNNDLTSLRDKLNRALEKEKVIRKDYKESFNFISTND